MLGQYLVTIAAGIRSYSPGIIHRERYHSLKSVPIRARAWAGDEAPLFAIPPLDEGLVGTIREVVSHGPELVGSRGACHTVQKIGIHPWVCTGNQAPGFTVPVVDQHHLSTTSRSSGRSHCPDVLCRERHCCIQPAIMCCRRSRCRDDSPLFAIPVLDQCLLRQITALIVDPHGPGIILGEGSDPIEDVGLHIGVLVEDRARDDLPPCAVPALDERLWAIGAAGLSPNGPEFLRARNTSYTIQLTTRVDSRTGNDAPLFTIPVFNQRLVRCRVAEVFS